MPKATTHLQKSGNTRRSNKRSVLIIIITALVVAGTAVYVGTRTFLAGTNNTVSVEIPKIETTFRIPSTGEERNVQTVFTVQLERDERSNVSNEQLEEALISIMHEMDIEKVLGEGGVEYINTRATELLAEHLEGSDANTQVYLVDIAKDDNIEIEEPVNSSNDVMNGLFKNIK